MGEQSRPPQFDIDQKWDKVIDLSLRRVVYGSLAAGLTSLVLFSEDFLNPHWLLSIYRRACCIQSTVFDSLHWEKKARYKLLKLYSIVR